jgi:RNA polymerase sigma-70 factor (ECF subfamily)
LPVDVASPSTPSDDCGSRHVILEVAMSRLTPDHRAVLVLSRFHDLGYDEIARIIDCSPGAARVRLHRAMNELRQMCFALEERCV